MENIIPDQNQKNTIPPDIELPAYRGEEGCLRVWCAYCCQWHYHGTEPGHRWSHCFVADSGYRETGYSLVDAGEWTDKIKKQYRERRPARCKHCHALLSPVGERKCPRCAAVRAEQLKYQQEQRSLSNRPSGRME